MDKLDQGIGDTKQMVQLQTMGPAQEYFGWSVETLEQQVEESVPRWIECWSKFPGDKRNLSRSYSKN